MDVMNLVDCFVVEVGMRQAWPFIVFGNDRDTPATETRLYIDAQWTINETTDAADSNGTKWMISALELNNCTVTNVLLDADHNLRIETADGNLLTVSGEAARTTVGEPWWFTPRRSL
jgi:hypothetical protein